MLKWDCFNTSVSSHKKKVFFIAGGRVGGEGAGVGVRFGCAYS